MNNYGKPQNATAQQDERAHELAEQLNLLKAVDRRITPEHLERRFHELARRLGDADPSAPADVNRQVLRESGSQRAGLRHRRLPKILRRLPVLLFAGDALLLLYFFSDVTDVNWAQPLSAALVFAVLLATMVTGISFAFFRFAGNRLQQYKDDTGTVPLRGLDKATIVSVGLALVAMAVLAALIFIRMRAEVNDALGPGAGGTAIMIGLTLTVISILANTLVIAVYALDGPTEADRLHAPGRARYEPITRQHALLEQAETLDPRIAATGQETERPATEGITAAGNELAAAARLIDAARAAHQGTGPLSEPAADPRSQDGNTGSRRTGGEPKADEHRARRARRGSRRFRPSRWTDAVALAAAAVLTIALVIAGTVFGLRFSVAPASQPVAIDPYPAVPAVSVVIAATATANEPAPTLSADTLQILRSAADSSAGAAASVVSPSDGQATVLPLTPRGSNALLRAEALKADAVAVERALDNEAAAGQLNLLATITAATRAASRPGTLIVVSSGLSTAGGFNLRQVGWGADPSSVAAQLKASGLLPDLAGWRVVFVGLGVVAGRQPALPQPQQVTLADYWTAICQASGAASCSVDHSARPQLASHVTGQVPVVPVPVVASVRGPGSTSTTTLPSTLLFPFNGSTLVPSADTILQPIAQKARSQHLLVSITGYTSPDGGSNAYNLALSAKRADAVRDRLVALGLPAKQIIQVIGAGTAGKGPDACKVNGHLDEAICAQLRRVVVVLSPAKANP